MPFVTVEEAKSYLEIDHADEDVLVGNLVANASDFLTNSYSYFAFEPSAVVETFDGGDPQFFLTQRPVDSVTAVTDLRSGDPIDPEAYALYGDEGRIEKLSGYFSKGRQRWSVEYDAGDATTPGDVKQATLFVVASWYRRRDPEVTSEKLGRNYSYTIDEDTRNEVDKLMTPYNGDPF